MIVEQKHVRKQAQAYDFTDYATKLVADWPPLTEAQSVRLRAIFGGRG